MPASEPRIFLSTGDPSGDLHGAALAEELKKVFPRAYLYGLAGPRMREAGVEPIADFERLLVIGIVEILGQVPFFIALRRDIGRRLENDPPDLVIPIDYPGINLWLTRRAHARAIPVLYYIAPQVWAWRPKRTRILAEHADHVAVVLPLEEPFLRNDGVNATYVGHPLVERRAAWPSRRDAIAALGLSADRPILGLLPGSRPSEVRRHLDRFVTVARVVKRRRPQIQVVVSGASDVPPTYYRTHTDYTVFPQSEIVLSAATAVLTKSGTTTLEATLRETPMVIGHRVNPLSYVLARRLISLDWVGIVNLLADREVVPEFIQDLPTDAIAAALMPLLDERDEERGRMVADLRSVSDSLGTESASNRVAALARELLEGSR